MGICRDSRHKRRHTGGRRHVHKKKRKFELGRPAAMTKLVAATEEKDAQRIRIVRVRGGNRKFRALRLSTGNFSWGTECCTRKTRILNVVYNASNNELVRTNTLVKGCIVRIDASPFKTWFEGHYGQAIGAKGQTTVEEGKKSKRVQKKRASRIKGATPVEKAIDEQFSTNHLLARISSRPGQTGRADGYILEGKELEFYQRMMHQKKGKKKE